MSSAALKRKSFVVYGRCHSRGDTAGFSIQGRHRNCGEVGIMPSSQMASSRTGDSWLGRTTEDITVHKSAVETTQGRLSTLFHSPLLRIVQKPFSANSNVGSSGSSGGGSSGGGVRPSLRRTSLRCTSSACSKNIHLDCVVATCDRPAKKVVCGARCVQNPR